MRKYDQAVNPAINMPVNGSSTDKVDRYNRYISYTKSLLLELLTQGEPRVEQLLTSLLKFYLAGVNRLRAVALPIGIEYRGCHQDR